MSRIPLIWILASVVQAAGAAQLGAGLDATGQNLTFKVYFQLAGRSLLLLIEK